ncbi:MAG: hypothetical protein ACP5D2_03855 [Candidatus Nanoarchaeia archaeon]
MPRKNPKKKEKLPRVIERTPQAPGKSNFLRDIKRQALAPGKRISKTGKIYWETRRNRSDLLPKRKI